MLASSYPLLDLFWTMLEIFLFIMYLWILIAIFSDIFRSHDLGGGAKALWVLFVIIIPFVGILAYLIVRGGSMQERAVDQARSQQKQFDNYVRQNAGGSTNADQLDRLAELRRQGAITDSEFEAEKAKIIG